ncbi:RNA polymerase sigma factor [Spongisporangium articulatum]|uniref:RNA polymerase sigma factor n=1 Tax=Spongisporangium articulatum TaxID=3362603 RepID=A0ABW8AHF3_9ACTN
MSGPGGESPAEEFRRLYTADVEPLLRYALRRVPSPEDAADVVAEVFLTAWRRIGDVPPGNEARLWLYGVARNVLANRARGEARRERLADRLRQALEHRAASAARAGDPAEAVGVLEVRTALARLSDDDRELLTLSAWEELEPREIAAVLGLEPGVVRTRLSRARARLRAELDSPATGNGAPPTGHERSVTHLRDPKEVS